jgi:chaperonin cofactor prefoldin
MQKQRRKLEKLVEDDEKAINELEGAISALETVMSTVEGSTEENFTKYASLKKQLDEVVSEWEMHMESLDE